MLYLPFRRGCYTRELGVVSKGYILVFRVLLHPHICRNCYAFRNAIMIKGMQTKQESMNPIKSRACKVVNINFLTNWLIQWLNCNALKQSEKHRLQNINFLHKALSFHFLLLNSPYTTIYLFRSASSQVPEKWRQQRKRNRQQQQSRKPP